MKFVFLTQVLSVGEPVGGLVSRAHGQTRQITKMTARATDPHTPVLKLNAGELSCSPAQRSLRQSAASSAHVHDKRPILVSLVVCSHELDVEECPQETPEDVWSKLGLKHNAEPV